LFILLYSRKTLLKSRKRVTPASINDSGYTGGESRQVERFKKREAYDDHTGLPLQLNRSIDGSPPPQDSVDIQLLPLGRSVDALPKRRPASAPNFNSLPHPPAKGVGRPHTAQGQRTRSPRQHMEAPLTAGMSVVTV